MYIAGYAEQEDIHNPNMTVRESLAFSCLLRLLAKVTDAEVREKKERGREKKKEREKGKGRGKKDEKQEEREERGERERGRVEREARGEREGARLAHAHHIFHIHIVELYAARGLHR